ncbi:MULTISPECIES: DUF1579 family protein [Kordiimonas]|jgi:hypothetical protein|uniref:DUF1579 family protein n=1 Tax=Kordiimonas TaxID=288021 RepID=UPI00257A1D28|nr:DUF1579 family protein [Kordiimonas sp. UBA4487]
MTHLLKSAGLFLLVIFAGVSVQATDTTSGEDGIDRLSFMEGRWTIVAQYHGEDGWDTPLPAQRATADTVLGKSFVRLNAPVAFPGATFQFEMTLSYDRFHNIYRFAFLDDLNGYMDIYTGGFEGDTLIVTNANTGTDFPDGNGGVVIGKLEIMKTESGYQLLGHISGSKEGPYTPYMKLTFTPAD